MRSNGRKAQEQALKAQREKRAAELLNRERRERGGDLEMTSLSDKLSKVSLRKSEQLVTQENSEVRFSVVENVLSEDDDPAVFTPNNQYPWTESLFEDHNEKLLNKMREVMILDITEESLPVPLIVAHNKQEMKRRNKLHRPSGQGNSRDGDHDYDEGTSIDQLMNETAVLLDNNADAFYLNVLLPSKGTIEPDLYDTATNFNKNRYIAKTAQESLPREKEVVLAAEQQMVDGKAYSAGGMLLLT